jgi:hypothetical protein
MSRNLNVADGSGQHTSDESLQRNIFYCGLNAKLAMNVTRKVYVDLPLRGFTHPALLLFQCESRQCVPNDR